MKQTFRKLLVTVLVLCTFVGVLPMIAAEDFTAQAAAATVYYDFRKGNNGYPNAAADKVTAFKALTYDEVAARNTTITSGAWAYHSYSATPDSSAASTEQTSFTSGSFFYYHYDKTKGFTMLTGARQGVLTAGIKFKGMNAGKYVPYLNINGSYLRTYSGTLTAKIYPLNSSTAIVTKEICLSDYPEDDSYVQLSNAVSFSASEYVLELTINNERTITIINGLQLVAADSIIVTGLYPTNDLGVYEVKVGQTINVPFTQVFSDGTVTTNKLSGWGYTTNNSYVTAGVNSSSRYFTLKGVAETSTPQTVYFSIGNAKVKLNVIVRASNYTATQSDVVYNFKKARPINWSANHVHNFGKHIKYSHTAVGGYAEVNTAITSAPWKVKSIPSTSDFSVLYNGYGIEHRGNGTTDLMIQVPVAGTYMPQLQLYPTIGAQTEVTVSILTTGGSTVCTKTIAAGTTTEYINLATNGVNLSATEYIVRFNKPSTGSSKQAGANYYDGIKLVKTNNTTVTLDPNGGTATGNKPTVTATYGANMPPVDDAIPTKTGYTFNGYYDTTDTSGTRYYNQNGKSWHVWDKSELAVTLYAAWKANTYKVQYNANGGSGSMSTSSHTYDAAKALTANAFTRAGYTFLGWATSSSATSATYTDKQSVSNLTSTSGATVNLYAVWKKDTYTVTFNFTSGTGGTTSVTATYGSAMPSVTPPTKTGFTFKGYYDAESGGTQNYNADGTSAKNWDKEADATLYARWSRNTYAVTLNANGGTAGTTSVTASYNLAMPAIETLPTKTGYTFKGYYDAQSGGTQYYTADGSSAKDWNKTAATTLYAQWTANTYTVKFSANAGSGSMSDQTFTYDVAQNLTANTFTRTGYTFAGWSLNSVKYTDGQSVKNLATSGSVTLYATWTPNTYTVTFNANGGVAPSIESKSVTYNSTYEALATTSRTGYTFDGWYTAASGGTKIEAGTKVAITTAQTLYAHWTANTYTVTLSEGGTVTATYDVAMPSITAPAKDGYLFAGYYDGENGEGTKYYNTDGSSAKKWDKTEAITLYAKWIQGEVTITPIGDKTIAVEENLTFTVEASSTIPGDITYTAENLPAGATFDSATGKFSWTPTKDQVGEYTIAFKGSDGVNYAEVTIKVTVSEIKTAVTFDEGQENDVIATYGKALPTITAPKKNGFMFDGYYDGANGTGTKYYNADGTSAKVWDKKDETITLYAKWIEGDDRLGTRVAVIRDIRGTREDSDKPGYSFYMVAGLDDRQLYDEVGFEVTINGQTKKLGTNVVYKNVKDDNNTYAAGVFGEKCNFVFVINLFVGKEYRDATVTFRAYAIDEDGNTIYGKSATFEGIYNNLEYDEETGGDLVVDGEVEYA